MKLWNYWSRARRWWPRWEKADPQELAAAVLHYCEAAGYTIEEVNDVMLALYREVTEASRECQRNTKFISADDMR